jgi:hypothetical protein
MEVMGLFCHEKGSAEKSKSWLVFQAGRKKTLVMHYVQIFRRFVCSALHLLIRVTHYFLLICVTGFVVPLIRDV